MTTPLTYPWLGGLGFEKPASNGGLALAFWRGAPKSLGKIVVASGGSWKLKDSKITVHL